MFLTKENYITEIKTSISGSSNILAAIAFWGDGAETLFSESTGDQLQIICNLTSGATNPETIKILIDNISKEKLRIRNSDTLHAKTLIFEKSLITGSANFSSNGLGLESEESAHWHEAGVRSTDINDVSCAKTWFSNLWDSSEDITELMLKQAEANWKKRQHNRPRSVISASLLSQNLASLKNRPISIIIYRNRKVSEHTENHIKSVKDKFSSENTSDDIARMIGCYEDWDNIPDDTFIISFHFPKKGSIKFDGIWKRLKDFDYTPTGENIEHESVQIVKKENLVDGYKLTKQDCQIICKRLKINLDAKSAGFISETMNLYDFLKENIDIMNSN